MAFVDKAVMMYAQFKEMEEKFKLEDVYKWHADHTEVPIFAVCAYFLLVFWVPGVLKAWNIKLELKSLMIFWNMLLAVFSMLGASRTIPTLLAGVQARGFEGSICDDGAWFLNGVPGFWVAAFIYSKVPELIDTVFLVVRGRPVILLHWFHHCTVLLYCWHAYLHKSGPGIWFATMNFTVHAIMYSYYALMAAKLGKLLAPIAPLITGVQILQMAGGMAVIITAGRRWSAGGSCAADPANLKLGFAMYASYFILFGMLFLEKYIKKPSKGGKGGKPGSEKIVCGVPCNSTDSTGRFNDYTSNKDGNGKKDSGKKKD